MTVNSTGIGAVCEPSQLTQQCVTTNNDADQRAIFPLLSIPAVVGTSASVVAQKILSIPMETATEDNT